jgi:hypothetical protein
VLERISAEKVPCIQIEIAFTCSKLRPDGFGGAAVFISRENGIQVHGTSLWLREREQKLEQMREAALIETDQAALDQLVHATATKMASEINSKGKTKQREYLLMCGWAEPELRETLATMTSRQTDRLSFCPS